MRRGIAVIALVMMFASDSSLFGSSLARREPTAGADLIAYQLTLGSTMKRDGGAAELFANDRTGAAAFESRAAETIREYLRQHGIATEKDSLETKAKVYFSASFYGHRIEASSCKDVYVFYLTASGTEHTPTEGFEETWEWSSLNSASAADLETSLIHELELALQDFLAERPVVPDKESLDKPSAQPKASSGRKPHNARFRVMSLQVD
jgi:hypothetical protein